MSKLPLFVINNFYIPTKKEKLNTLKLKLETRIKQKAFKYTEKDVLIAKKALAELDKLSSYYLTESVKILEPIINSVLEKIGFIVSFTINDNDRFTISLQKEGIEYTVYDFDGDYYSLQDLVPLLAQRSVEELLEQIMEYPLPERKVG